MRWMTAACRVATGLVAAGLAPPPLPAQELPTQDGALRERGLHHQLGRAAAETLRALVPGEGASLRLYDAGHRLPAEFAADAAAWLVDRL